LRLRMCKGEGVEKEEEKEETEQVLLSLLGGD
jgi:hypothetical protein